MSENIDEEARTIASRLTKTQRGSTEAIMRECCGDQQCWDYHDLDAYLPPGCGKCGAMAARVRAVLAEQERGA